MLHRILVPIDGTECSWRALEYACGLVQLSGGSLVVMTVTKGQHAEPVLAAEGESLFAHIGNEVLDSANAMLAGKGLYLFAREWGQRGCQHLADGSG